MRSRLFPGSWLTFPISIPVAAFIYCQAFVKELRDRRRKKDKFTQQYLDAVAKSLEQNK